MTAINPGAFVTRKGGDGTQMLVTSLSTGFSSTLPAPVLAQVSYSEDGGITFATIPVEDLELQVSDQERSRYLDAMAAADDAERQAAEEARQAEWLAEDARLKAEEATNAAAIAAAVDAA